MSTSLGPGSDPARRAWSLRCGRVSERSRGAIRAHQACHARAAPGTAARSGVGRLTDRDRQLPDGRRVPANPQGAHYRALHPCLSRTPGGAEPVTTLDAEVAPVPEDEQALSKLASAPISLRRKGPSPQRSWVTAKRCSTVFDPAVPTPVEAVSSASAVAVGRRARAVGKSS
jgi:hypothetical protein